MGKRILLVGLSAFFLVLSTIYAAYGPCVTPDLYGWSTSERTTNSDGGYTVTDTTYTFALDDYCAGLNESSCNGVENAESWAALKLVTITTYDSDGNIVGQTPNHSVTKGRWTC